jgi:hypothetical protein
MSFEPIPIACNPQALTADVWAAHQVNTQHLFQELVAGVDERPDGYVFHFPAIAFLAVAAFVEHERRCCPFFTFTLRVPPGEAGMSLHITGNAEAKAVLVTMVRDHTQPTQP